MHKNKIQIFKKLMLPVCCLVLSFSSFGLVSCGDDEVLPEKDNEEEVDETSAPNWEVSSNRDVYPSGMYILVDGSGTPTTISNGDLLAAFINGECCGKATVFTGSDSYTRAELRVNITTLQANKGTSLSVELRYYSTKNKRVYTANSIAFQQDATLGDYKNGYKPTWNNK